MNHHKSLLVSYRYINEHILHRESTSHASWMAESPMYNQTSMARSSEQYRVPSLSSRRSSIDGLNEQSRAPNVFIRQTESFNSYMSATEDFSRQTSFSSYGNRNVMELPPTSLVRIPHSRSIGGSSIDPWEGITRSSHTSGQSSVNYEEITNATPSVANYEESEAGSVFSPSLNKHNKDLPFSPPNHDLVSHMTIFGNHVEKSTNDYQDILVI